MRSTKVSFNATEQFEVAGRGTLYAVPEGIRAIRPNDIITLNGKRFRVHAVEHSGSARGITGQFLERSTTPKVVVGNYYMMRLKSGPFATVQISRAGHKRGYWHAINLSTGRELLLRSSRRLRREATPTEVRRAQELRKRGRAAKSGLIKANNIITDGTQAVKESEAKSDLRRSIEAYAAVSGVLAGAFRLLDQHLKPDDAMRTSIQDIVSLLTARTSSILGHLAKMVERAKAASPSPIDPPSANKPATYPSEKPIAVGPLYSEDDWAAKRRAFQEAEQKADEEFDEDDEIDFE